MDSKIKKAFEHMLAGKQVRITKEGREFWSAPSTPFTHGRDNLGQWFHIQAVRADGVDITGVNHDTMEGMPIEYLKL